MRKGFPVAEPVVYCADESVTGTAFYVMGYVEGRVIWVPDMPDSNPAERTAVFDAMNATLARLHSYEPAAIGLADYGRGENYVARQVDRWSKQYRASETEKIDEMERIMEWLPAHLPPAGPVRLVHGDYRLDNMILHRERAARARGARLGAFHAGRSARRLHLSLHAVAHAAFGLRRRHRLAGRARPRRRSASRRSPTMSMPMWRAPGSIRGRIWRSISAYNFFRLAAILQGIVGRVRDGTATNENAPARAQMVRPLAATAWEFARAGGRQVTVPR